MSEHDVIEALDEIDRRKELMPKHCPSWCIGDHERAIEEGCDVKSAAGHLSADVGHYLPDLRNAIANRLDRPGNAGWRLVLVAGWPGPSDMPLVEVELHEWTDIERREVTSRSMFLSSGEARTLAAQLVAMADKLDLP